MTTGEEQSTFDMFRGLGGFRAVSRTYRTKGTGELAQNIVMSCDQPLSLEEPEPVNLFQFQSDRSDN